MQTDKEYDLAGCKVLVIFEAKLIRIVGSRELLDFISINPNTQTLKLVKLFKADYLVMMGKRLKITNASLMVEIWAHLYASKFSNALSELIKLRIIQNITAHVAKRSDTIDCGEAEVDTNRKFWDVISKFNGIISKFL